MTPPIAEISLSSAAERLGVHYMTAYRYVRTGALPAEQRRGHWYIGEAALAEFQAGRTRGAARPGRPPSSGPAKTTTSTSPQQALALADRLVSGDQGGAWDLVRDAIESGAGLGEINARLLTPALCRVGSQWEVGDISVGSEHRATVTAMRLIERTGRHFVRRGRKVGTVLVSAAPGDRHALPSAILADLLRSNGMEVVDLGADTPGCEIAKMAADQDRLIGVGICATGTLSRGGERSLRDAVRRTKEATGRPVLIGGSGLADESVATNMKADHRSEDAAEAVRWFLRLAHQRRATS